MLKSHGPAPLLIPKAQIAEINGELKAKDGEIARMEQQVDGLKEEKVKLKKGLENKAEKLRFCAEQALSLQKVNGNLQREVEHLSIENQYLKQNLTQQQHNANLYQSLQALPSSKALGARPNSANSNSAAPTHARPQYMVNHSHV